MRSFGPKQVLVTDADGISAIVDETRTTVPDASQALVVRAEVMGNDGSTSSPVVSEPAADSVSQAGELLGTFSVPHLFNGATLDRERNNYKVTPFAAGSRTADEFSSDITNHNGRGVVSVVEVTSVSGSSPTLDIKLHHVAPVASSDHIWTDSAGNGIQVTQCTSAVVNHIVIYPGLIEKLTGGGRKCSIIMPRVYSWKADLGGSSPNFTFSQTDTLMV